MSIRNLRDALPELRESYRYRQLIPFLGAGFSIPLKLPSWSELVEWMARRLGWEPELFALHGTAPQLAEFFSLEGNQFADLVHEMIRKFDAEEVDLRRKDSVSHRALASLSWDTIYTTNYDAHIEGALADAGKSYDVIASLPDFVNAGHDCAGKVIKFHGTLSRKETIVLNESHYFARMELNAAVDQRLRADLLQNRFLFIGYSFSDTNIRYIWYRIHKLLEEQRPPEKNLRRSFLVTFQADPVQPKLLEKWNIDVIQLDPSDKSKSIAECLCAIGQQEI